MAKTRYRDPKTGRFTFHDPNRILKKEIYIPTFDPDRGVTRNPSIASRTARFRSEKMQSYIELTKPDGTIKKQKIDSDKLQGETYFKGRVIIDGVPFFRLKKNAILTRNQIKSIRHYASEPSQIDEWIEDELYPEDYKGEK